MDNLTHSLCGWIIARAAFGRREAWAAPTLIVAANLPDMEILQVAPWGDKATYLYYHRGISHSVVGMALQAVLLALAVWGIGRALRERMERPPRFTAALAAAALGVYSHLLLDWFNSYGVRPWLPFDSTRYYGDMAFIADPWMWIIVGGAIFLGSPPSRFARALWLFLAAMASTVVCGVAVKGWVPWDVPIAWAVLLGIVLALRWEYSAAAADSTGGDSTLPFARKTALCGLALWAAYLVLLFGASRASVARAGNFLQAGNRAELKLGANPVAGIPWRFVVIAQDAEKVQFVAVDLFAGTEVVRKELRSNLDAPELNPIKETFPYRAWRSFARFPVCNCQGGHITLGDARYKITSRGDWSEIDVPVSP